MEGQRLETDHPHMGIWWTYLSVYSYSDFPGSGRFPGEGNGNPLQYSCLENPSWTKEPGGLQSMTHKESDTTEATEHTL